MRRETSVTGKLRVQYLWDNAMLPVRGIAGVAGYNIRAANDCIIPAKGKGTMETGLAVLLPPGNYVQIAPQSGLAIRNFIGVGAGVVDSDFWERIKVIIFNHSANDFPVKASD